MSPRPTPATESASLGIMSDAMHLPHSFRAADVAEDHNLSVILYNAFLLICWFQGLSAPLSPIPASPLNQALTTLQRARLSFYYSLIKSTRLLNGSILILSSLPPNDSAPIKDTIHAILLWLSLHRRLTITKLPVLYQSGSLSTLISYGPSALYRVNLVFGANIDALFASAGVDAAAAGFVQMLAANQDPACRGRGSASRLLAWQIARHEELYPGADVLRDTTTEEGKRAYERLGFEEIGSKIAETVTNISGIKLTANADDETRRQARIVTVQRVMLRRVVGGNAQPPVTYFRLLPADGLAPELQNSAYVSMPCMAHGYCVDLEHRSCSDTLT